MLTLEAPQVGALTEPGQFVMLKTTDGTDPMLRRPFSVFEVLRDDLGTVRAISVLNKRAGRTTGLLYDLEAGDEVSCLGPLGLPFNPPASGAAWMVAGGVGLAPFATLAEALVAARGADHALLRRAHRRRALLPGVLRSPRHRPRALHRGRQRRRARGGSPARSRRRCRRLDGPALTTIYACGPEPMLAAVARLAARYGQPSEVSMERTMGCGLGGCYSCVVPVKHDDGQTRYVRSCIGGPVFDGAAVAWD